MATVTSTADEIQQEMRQVRAELRDNVQEIVSNAREIVDWQTYAKNYPWMTVGAAALVGYLLVPSRTTVIRPDKEALLELAKSRQLFEKMEQKTKPRSSLMGMLVGMAASTAAQAAMAVASQQVDQLLKSMQQPAPPRSGELRHD